MDKVQIIDEIRRIAKTNGGKPPGVQRFYRETCIREVDWRGKHWARWGDALKEAGYEPNRFQAAYSDELVLKSYISLTREYDRFPVKAELRMRAHTDKSFPSESVFSRFGSKQDIAKKLREYCLEHPGCYDDIIRLCDGVTHQNRGPEEEKADVEIGFVYLIRSGRYYKVGRSNAVGRRVRELAIQLPEKANTVHVIRTDDPAGIETYWHGRFESKRKNGEWFDLSRADVSAFRRRKFM